MTIIRVLASGSTRAGSLSRTNLRRIWPARHSRPWFLSARVQHDDYEHMHPILSVPHRAGSAHRSVVRHAVRNSPLDPSHYADAQSASFYPSFASISTHFMRLRATAVGIAIAGSGVGEPRTFDAEKTGRLTRRARRCGLPHHLSATLRSHRLRLDGASVRIPLARPMRHWKRNDHQPTDASAEVYVTSA